MTECKCLSVKSGKTQILNDISISFPQKQITVILGKNGSGKTTLLKALEKEISYTGEIRINGKELRTIPSSELSKIQSLMPQKLPTPHVTAEKLISFGRSPYLGISGTLSVSDKKITESAIEKTGVEKLRNSFADTLSGGELRRVFFAMILAQDTDTVLLDEPTSNLDISAKKEILELIKEYKVLGKTVVAVLHDVNDALEIADNIIVLENGKVFFKGSPTEFETEAIPQKIFGMEKYVASGPTDKTVTIYK